MKQWTDQQVLRIVCNPVYAGIHPFPRTVDDEMWIKSASRAMKEMGRESFLRMMLSELRSSMESARNADESDPVD